MNYTEILGKLKELNVTNFDFSGTEGSNYYYEEEDKHNTGEFTRERKDFYSGKKDINIDGLGHIKIMEKVGGYNELQDGAYGMNFHIIRYFVDHDVYIKLDGYYSSEEGLEPGRYSQVVPEEKTITVFSKV